MGRRRHCEKYSEIHPDLVIMDITMPNMDGLESFEKSHSKEKMGTPNVVMCSAMVRKAWSWIRSDQHRVLLSRLSRIVF